jgi:type IV pilus assembly protein PilE
MKLSRGFTLVELMIVVVIAAILVSIAIPSYSSYVQRSRRTEAKSALLNMASLEERFYSTQNLYSANPADFGYAAGVWPVQVGGGYYQVLIPAGAVTPPAIGAPAAYTIQAVPVPGGMQAADTTCALFQINSLGVQFAQDTGGVDQTTTCWK